MPTISADRVLRAAALSLLLGASGIAVAGPTIEIDPRTEDFSSRAACEQALEKRHSAARSRLGSLSRAEKRANDIGKLKRNGDDHLSYVETVDLGAETAEIDMPSRQTELFTCRGSTLEHRIDYEAAGG
jgi:hypothetical protein